MNGKRFGETLSDVVEERDRARGRKLPPADLDGNGSGVHRLIITPKSAKTWCGRIVICYYPQSNLAHLLNQERMASVTIAGEVTCREYLKLQWEKR